MQGRLPKELAAEGVRDMETANQYLEQVFWPSPYCVAVRERGDIAFNRRPA